MNTNVINLGNGHAIGNANIADGIRAFADSIEKGECGDCTGVIIVVEDKDGACARSLIGRRKTNVELAGVFFVCAMSAAEGTF